MARQMVDVEDELGAIWALVGELTEQLQNNRALVEQLKGRSTNVKGQAAHVGTGFPLRRFNLDITDEDFKTELEAFSSHLVLENQQLQYENKQLNSLLKEYEATLENVMGKFRGVAHASQQHDISLHSYYTSLLQTLQTAHSSAHLHDNTSLSLLLTRLSTLLRSALRATGGEDIDAELAGLLNHDNTSNGLHLSDGSSGPSSPAKSTSSGKKSIIQRAPPRRPDFPGSLPGSSGGYAGTDGQGDWAMEREMEILRLQEENKALREMLAIAEESPAAQAVGDELKEEDAAEHSPSPGAQGRRKSSLTVEELEAGAEQEAAERERAIEEGVLDANGELISETQPGPSGPGTGLGGGAGVTEGSHRPLLCDSVLGFSAETAPPEEAIDDGPETPE